MCLNATVSRLILRRYLKFVNDDAIKISPGKFVQTNGGCYMTSAETQLPPAISLD